MLWDISSRWKEYALKSKGCRVHNKWSWSMASIRAKSIMRAKLKKIKQANK